MDTYGLFLKSMLNNKLLFNYVNMVSKSNYGLELKICWQIK